MKTMLKNLTFQRILPRRVRLWWESALAYREAKRLAEVMWRRSYSHAAPNWQPLDTTAGLISQIDNMHAGVLQRCEQHCAQIARLQATIQDYQNGTSEKPNT